MTDLLVDVAALPSVVRARRLELGVSVARLAVRTDLAEHTIHHFERGDGGTRWRTVLTIVDALHAIAQERAHG